MAPAQELDPPRPRPLAELLETPRPDPRVARLRMVATDVDGTLTRDGALCPRVVAAVAHLGEAGIEVVPVSGRPAGEVLGLARYLPGVQRAIAENGLLEIVPDLAPRWIDAPTDLGRLRDVAARLDREHGAGLRPAADAFCRLGDLAFERDGRDLAELERLRGHAESLGVHLIWSNVHLHLAEAAPDKGAGLLRCLDRWGVGPEEVLTVGDAPNDAGLFVPGRFAVSVGTADVGREGRAFTAFPEYVAREREADAFLTLAAGLLALRGPVAAGRA